VMRIMSFGDHSLTLALSRWGRGDDLVCRDSTIFFLARRRKVHFPLLPSGRRCPIGRMRGLSLKPAIAHPSVRK